MGEIAERHFNITQVRLAYKDRTIIDNMLCLISWETTVLLYRQAFITVLHILAYIVANWYSICFI